MVGGQEAGAETDGYSAVGSHSVHVQKAVMARQLGARGGGAALQGDDAVTRVEWDPQDEVAHLALSREHVQADAGRSLFLDSITMQDVEDRVRALDLSVLYGDVHGYQYPPRLKHFLRMLLLHSPQLSFQLKTDVLHLVSLVNWRKRCTSICICSFFPLL